MSGTGRRLLIVVIDDSSLESIRVPFLRMGVIQNDLCVFKTAETLLDGKALIDSVADCSAEMPLGLAFVDMSFESGRIKPVAAGRNFQAELESLRDTLGYTDGMPLRNGGIWLLQSLLSSAAKELLIPVLYSAHTDITDTLSPLSESLGFRVLTQLPAEYQIGCMLDFLSVAAHRRGVRLDCDGIRRAVHGCLDDNPPALDVLRALGDMTSTGRETWQLRYLYPQVFGRGLRLASKDSARARAIGEPLAHLCRLAAGGHQGILLRDLLAPETRPAQGLPEDNVLRSSDVLRAGMVLDAYAGILNADTLARLRTHLNRDMGKQKTIPSVSPPFEGGEKAMAARQWTRLDALPDELLRQIRTTEPSRLVCRVSGAPMSEADWRLAVTAALKQGFADRPLLMQVLGEVLRSLSAAVSGASLEVDLRVREREAAFALTWRLPQQRLLRQCDVPVPFRSVHRLLGLRVSILSEDQSRRTCFAPYQDWTPEVEVAQAVSLQPARQDARVTTAQVALNVAFDI